MIETIEHFVRHSLAILFTMFRAEHLWRFWLAAIVWINRSPEVSCGCFWWQEYEMLATL